MVKPTNVVAIMEYGSIENNYYKQFLNCNTNSLQGYNSQFERSYFTIAQSWT
jgi:hypothetical protein